MTNPDMAMNMTEDEASIDLKDLFAHLLIHWKPVALAAVIGAVIASVFCVVSNRMKDNAPVFSEEALESARGELTPYELAEADMAYEQYRTYVQGMETLEEYGRMNAALQLDARTAVGYNVQYLIHSDLGNTDSAFDSASLLSKEDYERIAMLLHAEVKSVKSFITISADRSMDVQTYDLERNEKLAGTLTNDYKLLLQISTLAPDEDTAKQIVAVVEVAMERKAKQLRDLGVTLDYQFVGDTWDEDAINRVITLQQDNTAAIASLMKTKNDYLKNTIGALTEDQQNYIRILRARDERENREKPASIKKIAAIGFLVGAFLLALCLVLIYLLGGRVHTGAELTDRFGLPLLRELTVGESKKKTAKTDLFKRWGEMLRYADISPASEKTGLLIREIVSMAKLRAYHSLYLASDPASPETMKLAEAIAEHAGEEFTIRAGSLVCDESVLDGILAADGVFLLPVTGHTRIKTVEKLLAVCARSKKPVLGCATVRDQQLGD